MKKFLTLIFSFILLILLDADHAKAQDVADFEALTLEADAVWNGIDASYGDYYSSVKDSDLIFKNYFFRNDYGYGMYESWYGFSYSSVVDITTSGFDNQYAAIAGEGALGSEKYAVLNVMMSRDTVFLKAPRQLDSVFVTNGTYPFFSMLYGDMFAKKFGGESGNDPDYFKLIIRGIKDHVATDTIEFYLADYRDENSENDYIVSAWEKIDLTPLGIIDMLEFSLESSDNGAFGMNTPSYFCLDYLSGAGFENLTFNSGEYWNGKSAMFGSFQTGFADGFFYFPNDYSINDYGFGVYEAWTGFAYSNMTDSVTFGFENQYSAYPASGARESENYLVCYNSRGKDTILLDEVSEISGAFITNGTYPLKAMKYGDMFAKKFGGENGSDPDYFLLTIRGIRNEAYTGTIEFYLADFRSEDAAEDYIVDDWKWVDFSSLGEVDMLEFSLSSSDNGDFGMNTPAYFCMDDINAVITGIQQPDINSFAVKLYPNPALSDVYIQSSGMISEVRIIDRTGREIMKQPGYGLYNVSISVETLPSGLYIVQVYDNESVTSKPLIIK